MQPAHLAARAGSAHFAFFPYVHPFLRFVELTPSHELDMKQLAELITPRTRLVSLVHVSNMLGCVADTQTIVELAQKVGAKVRGAARGGS